LHFPCTYWVNPGLIAETSLARDLVGLAHGSLLITDYGIVILHDK
jgi:hypothetical protein